MTDKTTCDRFVERLDSFVAGELPSSEKEEFRAHLETCNRCRALLRLRIFTEENAPERVRSSMPEGLDVDMWWRISNALPIRHGRRDRKQSTMRSWLMPLLAAAAGILLFINGYLIAELRQYRHREKRIVSYLSDRVRAAGQLTELDAERQPGSLELTRFGRSMLQYRADEAIRIADWLELLSRIPKETTILAVPEASEEYRYFGHEQRGFERYEFPIIDGIQVHEAIAVLSERFEDPERIVTLNELIDGIPSMLQSFHGSGDSEATMLQSSKGEES